MGKEVSVEQKFQFLFATLTWGSGIIIFIEGATLLRVLFGSRHRFPIKVLSLLIGYNFSSIAGGIAWKIVFEFKQTHHWPERAP